MSSLEGRTFAGERTVRFREDREGVVTGAYGGPGVVAGSLVGRRDGRDLSFAWSELLASGLTAHGAVDARVGPEGIDAWGLVEVPGTPWVRTRVAHPTARLPECIAFYGSVLGFDVDGPHVATPYDLVFIALPGGTQLELTAGGAEVVPASEDDLLVLYVPGPDDVAALRERLSAAGVAEVPAANPYWTAMGLTVRDPDGRLVVVAALPH